MPDHAILYDGDCGFCKRLLRRVLDRDADDRLRPVAIQSQEGRRLLAEIPEGRHLDSWHLVLPDGEVLSAGAAAAPLARLLPNWTWTAGVFERFPRTTERAYRLIADNRGRLGKIFVIPLLLALLALGGCGSEPDSGAEVAIYVSAPEGSTAAARVLGGAELALAEAGGEVDGLPVELVAVTASGPRGALDQAAAAANARQATRDSRSVAYVGEPSGQATSWSVPITNAAGLLQVAPARVPDGILTPSPGSTEVPEEFQPTGDRTLGALGPEAPAATAGEAAAAQRLLSRPGRAGSLARAGYLTTEAALEAIGTATDPTDRESVSDAFLAIAGAESRFGRFTVDALGRIRLGD